MTWEWVRNDGSLSQSCRRRVQGLLRPEAAEKSPEPLSSLEIPPLRDRNDEGGRHRNVVGKGPFGMTLERVRKLH